MTFFELCLECCSQFPRKGDALGTGRKGVCPQALCSSPRRPHAGGRFMRSLLTPRSQEQLYFFSGIILFFINCTQCCWTSQSSYQSQIISSSSAIALNFSRLDYPAGSSSTWLGAPNINCYTFSFSISPWRILLAGNLGKSYFNFNADVCFVLSLVLLLFELPTWGWRPPKALVWSVIMAPLLDSPLLSWFCHILFTYELWSKGMVNV